MTFARHLIIELDGNIGGPDSFIRPIGKQLANVLQVDVKYKAAPDIEIDENKLSSDQKYLLHMHRAI